MINIEKYIDDEKKDKEFIDALELLSNGTPLREGIEYIRHAGLGALIVIGDTDDVLDTAEGGFYIDCEFWPTRLYELAKMDGAIILSSDIEKIVSANTYIRTDRSISTKETGTRHQAADRLAKQTGKLVIAISQRRNTITIYLRNRKYILRETSTLTSGANQILLTLDLYIASFNISLVHLHRNEISGIVYLTDVVSVIQRSEMVRKTMKKLDRYRIELGSEGQFLHLLEHPGFESHIQEYPLVIRDYYNSENRTEDEVFEKIYNSDEEFISDLENISQALGFPRDIISYDEPLVPRGYRILSRIVRLPMPVIENVVEEFGNLEAILDADIEELQTVEKVGEIRAETIKEGLSKMKTQAYI